MKHKRIAMVIVGVLMTVPAWGELTDITQINQGGRVNAPGGFINKSLQQQIGAGHGDAFTPGSAVFIIKRDPARSVRRGRQIFQRKFTEAQGQGPRVNETSTGDITVNAALGAGLMDSCAGCHGRPRGSAGSGGDVVTRPDSRDAPHLFGLGLVEQLADEMTQDLRNVRFAAVGAAFGGAVRDSTPSNAPAWTVNTFYAVNARVSFANKEFRAIQAHTSQADWEPPNVPALWGKAVPVGICSWDTQIPYTTGMRVLFNNRVYQVRQNHTSQVGFEPNRATTLWQVVTWYLPGLK